MDFSDFLSFFSFYSFGLGPYSIARSLKLNVVREIVCINLFVYKKQTNKVEIFVFVAFGKIVFAEN